MEFELIHDKGKLIAKVTVNGVTHTKDVTEYFNNDNPHDDFLDYHLDLKYFAEESKLTKSNFN